MQQSPTWQAELYISNIKFCHLQQLENLLDTSPLEKTKHNLGTYLYLLNIPRDLDCEFYRFLPLPYCFSGGGSVQPQSPGHLPPSLS